jgi:hypothetical protein
MKVFFEEYQYSHEQLKGILSDHFHSPVSGTNRKRKINYVGYFCSVNKNGELKEPVMIFPKVFLKYDLSGHNPRAFGHFDPEYIIDLINGEKLNGIGKESHTPSLLYEMSVWLYRAIDKYRQNCENENISESGLVNPVISRKDNHSLTELEIVEALRLFYEQNQNLFTFLTRKSNSQNHRIKWSKTIARKLPVIVNDRPVYIEVYSKKKTIDYDEELIRIFFSVLYHLNGKYGFDFVLNINYDLIKGSDYKRLERKGYRYLKSIRYRYFNDKMLKLHELLSLYFERIFKSRVGHAEEEYLLIKDFNRVFEEMIDKLVGDKADGEIKKMKSQPDNKQLDHIYIDGGVFQKDDIYFIADSKYYTDKSTVDPYSSYKQFTYARNVLALNLDIFKKKAGERKLNYQDELTDGYHPTPNFFISAYYDDKIRIIESGLKKEDHDYIKRSSHWDNRLFDRDTLFTLSYRINFMFVIQTFVRRSNSRIQLFKKNTRNEFRIAFIEYLDSRYYFSILTPKNDFQGAIDKHFKLLLGISFYPSNNKDELVIAFEKEEKGIEKYHRGHNHKDVLETLTIDWSINNTTLIEYEKTNHG